MTIELYTEPLLKEIRQISHLEVQDIADPEARDNARAGLEKMDEIERNIIDGITQVRRRSYRFLTDEYTRFADNNHGALPESFVFEFSLAERRASNRAEPLAETMRALVVQYALAKFCASVNQTELSNRHSILAIEAGNLLEELLYTKRPPIL